MFLENEIEERTLALYESTFDHHLSMIINEDAIYTTESEGSSYFSEGVKEIGQSVSDFFRKIIQAIKDFLNRSKELIKKKITEFKTKKMIDAIAKVGMKNITNMKLNKKCVSVKTCQEHGKAVIKLSAECSKKIKLSKSIEEIQKYKQEFQANMDELTNKMLRNQKDDMSIKEALGDDPLNVEAGQWIDKYVEETLAQLENIAVEHEKELRYLERDKTKLGHVLNTVKDEASRSVTEAKELLKCKKEAIKGLGTCVASFFKRIGSLFYGLLKDIIACIFKWFGAVD